MLIVYSNNQQQTKNSFLLINPFPQKSIEPNELGGFFIRPLRRPEVPS